MTANTNPGVNPLEYLGVIATMPPNLYNFRRAPLPSDVGYVIGSIAVYPATNQAWILTSIVAGLAVWSEMADGSVGAIFTINTIAPVGGNFTLSGTANQIAITGGTGSDTFSLIGPYTPATYTAHGVLMGEGTSSIAASSAGTSGQVFTSGGASADGAYQTLGVNSGLTAHGVVIAEGASAFAATAVGTTGQVFTGATGADPVWSSSISVSGAITAGTNLTATAGNLALNGAASHVTINASAPTTAAVGFVTLSGSATTTLTSSAITANSIILFSLKTLGTLTASAITYTTTGGSATITPAGSTDTSVYGYLIIN